MYRSPGIYFTVEENPGKPQLGYRLKKGLCDQYLVGSHSTSGREEKGTSTYKKKNIFVLVGIKGFFIVF